jgi:hypothetical protein
MAAAQESTGPCVSIPALGTSSPASIHLAIADGSNKFSNAPRNLARTVLAKPRLSGVNAGAAASVPFLAGSARPFAFGGDAPSARLRHHSRFARVLSRHSMASDVRPSPVPIGSIPHRASGPSTFASCSAVHCFNSVDSNCAQDHCAVLDSKSPRGGGNGGHSQAPPASSVVASTVSEE